MVALAEEVVDDESLDALLVPTERPVGAVGAQREQVLHTGLAPADLGALRLRRRVQLALRGRLALGLLYLQQTLSCLTLKFSPWSWSAPRRAVSGQSKPPQQSCAFG